MPADRQDLRRRLFQVASTQAGYFTAADAKNAGYSYQAQQHHTGRGNWLRVDRGLYRLFEWPSGPDDEMVRWSLWAKGQGAISHESALDTHSIGEFSPSRVHLTVPARFSKVDSAVVLHRGELEDTDVQRREGYSVTTPVRSLIESPPSARTAISLVGRSLRPATPAS